MQGRGEINSPRPFCCWARRVLAQPSLLGRVGPRRELFWAEIGPVHFWAQYIFGPRSAQYVFGPRSAQYIFGPTSAHHGFGLSPAQWFGPAQPDLNIYYIYILYFVLFIYIYIHEKNIKIMQKL